MVEYSLPSLVVPPALISSLAGALAGLVALVMVARFRGSGGDLAGSIGAFAAAALLTVALVHLLPESFALSSAAPVFALGGFAAAFALGFLGHSCQEGAVRPALGALAPLLAVGLHSLLDGALHATMFAIDWRTGLSAAPGLVLHEVAETTLLFTLLSRSGLRVWSAAALTFLGAIVTTPVGVWLSVDLINGLKSEGLGAALALAAGSLIYLSVSHLAVQASAGRVVPRQAVAFFAGLAVTSLLLVAGPMAEGRLAHHHGHSHASP